MAFKSNQRTLDLPIPQLSGVRSSSGIRYLTDDGTFSACGVRLAFFERTGGVSRGAYASLNSAKHVDDDAECVQENRRRMLKELGADDYIEQLLVPNQVHGNTVVVADDANQLPHKKLAEGADAVLCTLANIPVLLNCADCALVVLVSPSGMFSVVHAGWRGALAGIASNALKVLCKRANCASSAVNAYIGPHIGACCYEVSEELLVQFCDTYGAACDAGERHLSLSVAIQADLIQHGASSCRIIDSNLCTHDLPERFFSYRASEGVCGRQGAMAVRLL